MKQVRIYVGKTTQSRINIRYKSDVPQGGVVINQKQFDQELDVCLKAAGIQGATVFDTVGYWKGVREQSSVIELLCMDAADNAKAFALAELLKSAFDQESVLIVTTSVDSVFI
jgi:hypothetical protein